MNKYIDASDLLPDEEYHGYIHCGAGIKYYGLNGTCLSMNFEYNQISHEDRILFAERMTGQQLTDAITMVHANEMKRRAMLLASFMFPAVDTYSN